MIERCLNCNSRVPENRGIRAVGCFGEWKGKRLVFCSDQCVIEWDCEGKDPCFKGNQALNLEEVLMKDNKKDL
jgi:hypothetical protein